MAEWISVKDRLPEPYKRVLAYVLFGECYKVIHEGFMAENKKWYVGRFDDDQGKVLAWREMPEPPKGE